MTSYRRALGVLVATVAVVAAGVPSSASAKKPPQPPVVDELATFGAPTCPGGCGSGSTIGPDKALYVTDGSTGRVLRVEPRTGDVTRFASGLPPSIVGFGGAMDVEFIGRTAYVLVTLVGPDVGGSSVVGIYRVDSSHRFTVVADIGAFAMSNPPDTEFFVPTGVQYAMEADRGGFLVTDGHHNRVLRVTRDGEITELIPFENIVPTGLAMEGNKVYMAEAGPVPHLPEDGKVVSFRRRPSTVTELASGAPLLVDVELGRGHTLYALSQGVWDGVAEGSPALPNTGALVRVHRDGTLTAVADGLDRPTSLEFIGDTGYVTTFTGKVFRIDNVGRRPCGRHH
jgi:sugar lactone lactonase YvrE